MLKPSTNTINPKKLLNSKWTRLEVVNKERHFIVSAVELDEDDRVIDCEIEAVINHRQQRIDWQDLKDSSQWLPNWR